MDSIEEEKRVIGMMIEIYCHGRHGRHRGDGLCAECAALLDYARQRLGHCPHGDGKPSCRRCRIHCYMPDMRGRIREVMRYSGPRMMLLHPMVAIRHIIA